MRRSALVTTVLILVPLALTAQAPDPVRFCVESSSLPMSMPDPDRGIDVELAQAVASRLGRKVELVWQPLGAHMDQALLERECDVAPGAVMDRGSIARSDVAPGLALSAPYAAAGYLLIRGADASPVTRLEELGDQRIGVEMESVAIYTLKQRGQRVYVLDDYSAVVRAVADGRTAYGYLWGPLAAWLTQGGDGVRLVEGFEPVESWDLSMAVRKEDHALKEALDEAIPELVGSGEISAIFDRWGVPYLAPASATSHTRTGGE